MAGNTNFDVDLTRVFNAPRELVCEAFTDPDRLAGWYGPVGFSVSRDTVDVDARVGGRLRLVMVSDTDPDLRSAVNLRFSEVVENQLLVGTEEWEGIPASRAPGRVSGGWSSTPGWRHARRGRLAGAWVLGSRPGPDAGS